MTFLNRLPPNKAEPSVFYDAVVLLRKRGFTVHRAGTRKSEFGCTEYLHRFNDSLRTSAEIIAIAKREQSP